MTASYNGVDLLRLLEHAVGDHGHRNHYAAADDSFAEWELLCELFLAVPGRKVPGALRYYHVSVPGVALLRALHPRRYSRELKGVPIPCP